MSQSDNVDCPYRPCNLVVRPEKTDISPMCIVYSNLIDPTSHAKVTIRVKPKTEPNPTPKSHRASGLHPNHPGVDVEKRMIDGYIFKNYDDEFLEACENKYQGFGACSSATIIPTVGVDFATFDME